MKKYKIAILVKTSINFDGRVISQIDSLTRNFNNFNFRVFLLPDAPYDISFDDNCDVCKIKLFTKKLPPTTFFKFFKMIEYGLRSFYLIRKFNPQILHVHDDTSFLGGFLYKLFYPKKHVIYDDHELNYVRPQNLHDKLMFFFEKKCFAICDTVIVANEYRKKISAVVYKRCNIEVYENLFYKRKSLKKFNPNLVKLLSNLKSHKAKGTKIILHQGQLNFARGENDFNSFTNNITDNFKVLMIGINHESFKRITSYFKPIIRDKFIFGSYVDYDHISEIYKCVDYSLIIYKNINFNNKYCAPNRVYTAAYFGVPILVNEDNIVLNYFATKFSLGLSFNPNTNFDLFFKKIYNLNKLTSNLFFKNKNNEDKIVSIYNKIILNT